MPATQMPNSELYRLAVIDMAKRQADLKAAINRAVRLLRGGDAISRDRARAILLDAVANESVEVSPESSAHE